MAKTIYLADVDGGDILHRLDLALTQALNLDISPAPDRIEITAKLTVEKVGKTITIADENSIKPVFDPTKNKGGKAEMEMVNGQLVSPQPLLFGEPRPKPRPRFKWHMQKYSRTYGACRFGGVGR